MKISKFKDLVKECLLESILEINTQFSSLDPVSSGIKKLESVYNTYENFIPDEISYKKDPADPTKFVVIARESDKKQYVRLSAGLPEDVAEDTVKELKNFHVKELTKKINNTSRKPDPSLVRNVRNALVKLGAGGNRLNEMHYFPTLNIQYYASENLKIPKLSQTYKLYYRRNDGGFYLLGIADDADKFDNLAYIIKNKIGTMNQNPGELYPYTDPKLTDKDKRDIEEWSKKPEVIKRRKFEQKNFPYKQ
jgi:hypothetical protein